MATLGSLTEARSPARFVNQAGIILLDEVGNVDDKRRGEAIWFPLDTGFSGGSC
jgi:hypothetical protein